MGRPDEEGIAPELQPEHPWERQPGETDAAWTAFAEYRDLGPNERSMAKLGQNHGKDRRSYSAWSAEWDWVARCAAHDAWLDKQTKLAEVEAVKDMRRRHVELGMALQRTAALALAKYEEAEKRKLKASLKPRELHDLSELGAKLERLARGEPSEIDVARVEMAPQQDYSRLSTEELKTLIALSRKARVGVEDEE